MTEKRNQPDCQSTPELLGEDLRDWIDRQLAEARDDLARREADGQTDRVETYAVAGRKGALQEVQARLPQQRLLATQPVSESPGNSGEGVIYVRERTGEDVEVAATLEEAMRMGDLDPADPRWQAREDNERGETIAFQIDLGPDDSVFVTEKPIPKGRS